MTRYGADLERARRLLAEAERVVVLTGAGISAESGVPTFRGAGGLWKEYRAEELATPHAFARDPRLVWEWYAWRRTTVSACDPNPAHLALASFAADQDGVSLVTQNVDDLHERAAEGARPGEASTLAGSVLHLHGSLFSVRCTSCDLRAPHREPIDASSRSALPRCDACHGLLRPDVVWFGESLEPAVLHEAHRSASEADVCLVVGTSAVVYPAAALPIATRESGGAIVEVNPDETGVTWAAEVALRGTAAEVMPRLLENG